jgi:hypothetical protein
MLPEAGSGGSGGTGGPLWWATMYAAIVTRWLFAIIQGRLHETP